MNDIEYLKEFTQIYKSNGGNKYIREVECNFFMFKERRTTISSSDYFVSCFSKPICGFGSKSSSFIYYCDLPKLKEIIKNVSEGEKQKLEDIYHFWERENSKTKLKDKLLNVNK